MGAPITAAASLLFVFSYGQGLSSRWTLTRIADSGACLGRPFPTSKPRPAGRFLHRECAPPRCYVGGHRGKGNYLGEAAQTLAGLLFWASQAESSSGVMDGICSRRAPS